MAGSQRVLGRFGAAPVVVDRRILLTVVVVPLLVLGYLRDRTDAPWAAVILSALLAALLLAGSLLAHELAHALMARRLGVPVERIVLGPLGAGVHLDERRLTAGSTAGVAVVGPLASLALAAAGLLVMQNVPAGRASLVWWTAAVVGAVNAALGALNLLPALPMDGGKVLAALVWRATGDRVNGVRVAAWAGRALAVAVLLLLIVRPWLAGVQPDLVRVVWTVVTAGFLWVAAGASLRAARGQARVAALRLADLLVPAVALPGTGTLADLDAVGGSPVVLLGPGGHPTGYLDAAAAASVRPDLRATTPLTAVARALPAGSTVDLRLTGSDAVRAVASAVRASPVLAVVDGGVVVGLLRAADVVRAVQAPPTGRARGAGGRGGRT